MAIIEKIKQKERPIYIIGAGGIVNTAHLPAYRIAGFNVQGIFDLVREKAIETARKFEIPNVFETLDEMLKAAPNGCVFDIAVPGSQLISLLERLPDGAHVLFQKPMGEDFQQAKAILDLTRRKRLCAAVNFQLRYAPYVVAARKLIDDGSIGVLNDVEINVNVYTPWHLWDFLYKSARVEITYHSIHYIDLVRCFLGNPVSVYAKTTRHPLMKELASVRSCVIMDYGDMVRANILTNHCHNYGMARQQSYIKIEGDKGAVKIDFGALIDYPRGAVDRFEYTTSGGDWTSIDIEGSWFPHAFIGSMEQVMLAADGLITRAGNSVEDCIDTMACVEAAYESSASGGIRPQYN